MSRILITTDRLPSRNFTQNQFLVKLIILFIYLFIIIIIFFNSNGLPLGSDLVGQCWHNYCL